MHTLTFAQLKVESEFYGLGQGFHDLLKSKERILNMTTRGSTEHYMYNSSVKKNLDLKKTYIVKLQIQLDKVWCNPGLLETGAEPKIRNNFFNASCVEILAPLHY